MEKKKVLFVDDEPNVLQGLSRMLRPMRNDWNMTFVTCGEEALALFEKTAFDVVVSDMRMPGMDGAQLLAEIMKRSPNTVRFVLSGQSDRESILKSVGPAHQYLSKPCDAEALRRAIGKACAMRDVLTNANLRKITTQLKSIPSFPALYGEIMREIRSPDSSLENVGRIISKDVSMTAKILQLVNSAFFGQPRRISSPEHAVILLGLDTIRALVLSTGVFSQFSEARLKKLRLGGLLDHSLAVAVLAKNIAKAETGDPGVMEDAFMSGLLHDVGKLVLADNMPELFQSSLEVSKKEKAPLQEAEKKIIGASHAEVGGYLLMLWGLPDAIVEAVSLHHSPEKSHEEGFSPLTAVHVANSLESASGMWENAWERPLMRIDYIRRLGLEDRIEAWNGVSERLREVSGGN